jgi:hypothetical protein
MIMEDRTMNDDNFIEINNAEIFDINISDLTLSQTSVKNEIEPCSLHQIWEKARLDHKERAWAKFNILKRFIEYRIELKAKGFNYAESGGSFTKKLNQCEICFEDFIKLKVNSIALQH